MQWAHTGFEGDRDDLIGLAEVFLCREVLEVLQHMQPADRLTTQRHNMVNVVAFGAAIKEAVYGRFVAPFRGCNADFLFFRKTLSALISFSSRGLYVALFFLTLLNSVSLQTDGICLYPLHFASLLCRSRNLPRWSFSPRFLTFSFPCAAFRGSFPDSFLSSATTTATISNMTFIKVTMFTWLSREVKRHTRLNCFRFATGKIVKNHEFCQIFAKNLKPILAGKGQ